MMQGQRRRSARPLAASLMFALLFASIGSVRTPAAPAGVVTESQFTYTHGEVRCPSKARPCSFSENACRVTINLEHIMKREEADLHAAESIQYELGDGTYLDVFYGVLAEPTETGKAFTGAVNQIINESLKNLRERLGLKIAH